MAGGVLDRQAGSRCALSGLEERRCFDWGVGRGLSNKSGPSFKSGLGGERDGTGRNKRSLVPSIAPPAAAAAAWRSRPTFRVELARAESWAAWYPVCSVASGTGHAPCMLLVARSSCRFHGRFKAKAHSRLRRLLQNQPSPTSIPQSQPLKIPPPTLPTHPCDLLRGDGMVEKRVGIVGLAGRAWPQPVTAPCGGGADWPRCGQAERRLECCCIVPSLLSALLSFLFALWPHPTSLSPPCFPSLVCLHPFLIEQKQHKR